MLLLVPLTGRDAIGLLHSATIDEVTPYHVEEYIRNRQVYEILDAAIMTEAQGTGMEQQLQAMLQLALMCIGVP